MFATNNLGSQDKKVSIYYFRKLIYPLQLS